MDAFGWVDTYNVPTLRRDHALKEYFFLIKGLSDKKARINDIFVNRDTEYPYLCDRSVMDYTALSQKLALDLNELMNSATKCFEDAKECTTPTYTPMLVKWPVEAEEFSSNSRIFTMDAGSPSAYMKPVFSKEKCDAVRRAAFLSGCITAQDLRDLRKLNGAPSCDEEGQLISWGLCE
jgi:hypothetical protein